MTNTNPNYEQLRQEGMGYLKHLIKENAKNTQVPEAKLHELYLLEVTAPGKGKEKANALGLPPLDEKIISEFYGFKARMLNLLSGNPETIFDEKHDNPDDVREAA